MSIAGGLPRAVERGLRVDCTALQIFTKSSNQWKARELGEEEMAAFRAAVEESPIGFVVAHDSYLINLASPDEELWEKSVKAFILEIRRCADLGVPVLVLHPGAHKNTGEGAGLKRISRALNRAHSETSDCPVTTALETHAGQGTTLGHRFEHLRDILAGLNNPQRAAVCFDTCHVFAAGYPIHTDEGWNETLEAFDERVGLDRLACVHVNDSKKGLGCRVDRHAGLGQGEMGLLPFWHLVNDPRTRDLPMVLETPKGEDLAEDVVNLGILRSLAGGDRP
ncbi:MAG: deoxyribonuclease IV [Acidobacteria bacterium]|nr:MAG: deoxyribonuclease IV [Acidobacteriota bacterium]